MSHIYFNHEELSDLSFSSNREIIRTNRAGGYLATTLSGCNTRKYHGLLVLPIENFNGEKHVLLSQLEETIVCNQSAFPLSVRQYRNQYVAPQGHRYLHNFEFLKAPVFTFRAGGITLTKERVLVENEQQSLVRYSLTEAKGPVVFQVRPFLAFRNIHVLSKANPYAQSSFREVPHGIAMQLYDNYPWLYMQFSKQAVFRPEPSWYFDIEYEREKERGYEYLEDLFTPGYFEVTLGKDESVVFSAAVEETATKTLKQSFSREVRKRPEKKTLADCLRNAATQFIWHQSHDEEDIIAGYPWHNSISRQTFIAMPGLRLTHSDRQLGMEMLDSYLPYLKNGLFPQSITARHLEYSSADASLWFIWAIQQLRKQGLRLKDLGIRYGNAMKEILDSFREGTDVVTMLETGLLFAADEGKAYTWMDAFANGTPVTPRYGMPVELNALWYNAICFALEMAHKAGDSAFELKWKPFREKLGAAFLHAFWDDEKGYLADVYNGFFTGWSVRPNMVIAAAMEYTPLSREQQRSILEVASHHLLTPRGLRTLSPEDPGYRPVVKGSPAERDSAVHNGAVHPWLLQFYAEAWLRIHKKGGAGHIRSLINGFENEIRENCIGTIAEYYDGDPPHAAGGAVSQAWNVAALLNCHNLLAQVEKMQ